MFMSDGRIDPIVDAQGPSVLDQPQILNQINEEVAAKVEKTNPFKLLFNGKNKALLFLLGLVLVIGIFSIGYAIFSLDSEVSKKRAVEAVERRLPVGKQTEARRSEFEKYNEEMNDEKAQPIALEEIAKGADDQIDGSFQSEDLNIDPSSGCGLADTACMRIKRRIPSDGCAPKDEACITVMAAKKATNANSAPAAKKELTQDEVYLQRLNDKDYVSALSKKIASLAGEKQTLVLERGGAIKHEVGLIDQAPDKNGGTGIESGILKQEEINIEKFASTGDRLMGSAEIALNSKIEGEASFTIFGGKFLESRMIGSTKRVDDYMRAELHTWVLPDKRECRIKAIALDKKTTYAAIQSRVDHHTLYRYGWWGLGTVLGAIGKAAERNADKELVIVDGTVIESTTADSKREIRMAVGDLGSEIGKIMQKRIDTPSTVYVDINETVGIFFMAPVTSADCKFGGIQSEQAAIASTH